MFLLENRQNLVFLPHETWRPLPLGGTATVASRFVSRTRRFFDLQAASIWNDLAALMPKLDGHLLDAGCGAQPYRSLMPERIHYRAIDIHASREAFGYESPDTVYFSGERWPVADESQDIVLCTEVAEHVYEPAKLLSESFRCLKKKGRLVLTVPFAARWHFIPHDYWRFTPSSLDRLLSDAGFQNLRIYARGNAFTVFCYKALSLMASPLLAPHKNCFKAVVGITLGIVFLPFTALIAAAGTCSLMTPGGNDCLGYTVLADRP